MVFAHLIHEFVTNRIHPTAECYYPGKEFLPRRNRNAAQKFFKKPWVIAPVSHGLMDLLRLLHTVSSFRKQKYGHVEKCKVELFENS